MIRKCSGWSNTVNLHRSAQVKALTLLLKFIFFKNGTAGNDHLILRLLSERVHFLLIRLGLY